MKSIILSQGKTTIVDDEDYNMINQWKWSFDHGYASRKIYKNGWKGKATKIYLHRFLINPLRDNVTDHINGDKLDNRKENLRACTPSQNAKNHSMNKNNSLGYRGIIKNHHRWLAQIGYNKKNIYLGSFATKELAALAYNKAAKKYHGEFANLNIL